MLPMASNASFPSVPWGLNCSLLCAALSVVPPETVVELVKASQKPGEEISALLGKEYLILT